MDESPRYPIDTVIGALGRGQSSKEAYEAARATAAALVAGNMNASILSAVNRVFLESSMNMLNVIHPQYFRLGNGREEPDGSVSFLVRFIGREEGITGEIFIRFEERQRPAVREAQPAASEANTETEAAPESAKENTNEPVIIPVETVKAWFFEDLILEEARSREVENAEDRHRFDFSPYERFF